MKDTQQVVQKMTIYFRALSFPHNLPPFLHVIQPGVGTASDNGISFTMECAKIILGEYNKLRLFTINPKKNFILAVEQRINLIQGPAVKVATTMDMDMPTPIFSTKQIPQNGLLSNDLSNLNTPPTQKMCHEDDSMAFDPSPTDEDNLFVFDLLSSEKTCHEDDLLDFSKIPNIISPDQEEKDKKKEKNKDPFAFVTNMLKN